METSRQWIDYFRQNAANKRIDWSLVPQLGSTERNSILASLQAWQLGETSDGAHLLAAAQRYASRIGDPDYCEAVQLFIKEEQKHGNNLGRYIDLMGEKRIGKNWGDTIFRKIRYFNTSMELWTIAVITVESTAQVFYQALKDATACRLLKQVCTDILIDEAYHIDFQLQRLQSIFAEKSGVAQYLSYQFYRVFYFATIRVVWIAHRQAFKAGGIDFGRYMRKMTMKFNKTIQRLRFGKYTDLAAQELISMNHPV
jgi:hypothetical protein